MSHCHTITTTLRKRGYRITPQREMVINIIAHTDRHMSAEEIFQQLNKQTKATNLATVYRTLDTLWEEGFACRNDSFSRPQTPFEGFEYCPVSGMAGCDLS